MNEDYSEALKEVATIAPSDVAILETLSISHPEGGAINIVNSPEDYQGYSETTGNDLVVFKASAFALSLPESSIEGTQFLNLSFPNVTREASDWLNRIPVQTSSPAKVVYRVYLSSDVTSRPQNDPPISLTLSDIEISLTSASARCAFKSIINAKYPNEYYTLDKFPALSN